VTGHGDQLAARPGTYALILSCGFSRPISIGCRGELLTRPGAYLYVGSALGPGGLAARVGRHMRPAASHHWHIDYLRAAMPITAVWYTYDPTPREHQWAAIIQELSGAQIPLARFGASDCRCASHLFFFHEPPSPEVFAEALAAHIPDTAPLFGILVRSST
jgi:Uri superfamily endonuclease